ncbi:MAG: DUF2442 domain-containing protein [Verrucomicrobiota bacterium]
MSPYHQVKNIHFSGEQMHLEIDGQTHRFDLASISDRLAAASPDQRQHFQISPSGYGIHWPLIDEDLSIDGLLGIHHQPPKLTAAQ